MDDSQRNLFSVNYDLIREYSSETFCRLCFSQIHELHRVFPTNGQPNKLLVKKIEYCTDIGITFGKDSNACICTKCIALVEEFFRFKQLCSSNERWLKVDFNDNHVAPVGRSETVTGQAQLNSSNRSCSLLTIDTDDVDGLLNDETAQENISLGETLLKLEDSIEETRISNNDTHEVTSSGHCMRARKSTTRIVPTIPANSMTRIPIKLDSESDADATRTDSCDSREFSPVVEHAENGNGTCGFSIVRGSKSRSNRLYLVYQSHRYSNPSSDGKIWRCTHRAPIYCRAVVMLEKNRIIELNNHFHNHPPPNMSRKKKKTVNSEPPSPNLSNNVKISLVLKKEKESRRRPSRSCNQTSKQGEGWFIKANRKTVDGFTYTFCGLRKDGIIRLKCITKGCAGRVYMYSNGELFRANKDHTHPPHVAA
ncbi:uncharacterized protein LOC135701012 [Ochlerotatus camptorhynchus]|uniref:uncharacterized protein LOC135701012 n=1 Tax=Ochlerotatus camptorhynchus TaxID=644619 RepID=UPI0031D5561C